MEGNDTNDGGCVDTKNDFCLLLSLPDYAEELRFYLIHMTEVRSVIFSLSLYVKAKQGERTEGKRGGCSNERPSLSVSCRGNCPWWKSHYREETRISREL